MSGTLTIAFSFINLSISFCLVNLNSAQGTDKNHLFNQKIIDSFVAKIKIFIKYENLLKVNQVRRRLFILMLKSTTKFSSTVPRVCLRGTCTLIDTNYATRLEEGG